MSRAKPILMTHEGTTFNQQTVYLTGHAYRNCRFHLCTMVYSGGFMAMSHCEYSECVWHLDFLVHDSDEWDDFLLKLATVITKTLPRVAEDWGKEGSG